ncbi:hypothetical protein GCM10008956_31860 [Deinococcus arenae]|uniref:Uncharacterized protein n=1 Tax=Deinococcus arenae TaxID=1452751 RepID=A0A8H9L9X4_9DEIO|nr:hypothetical protein GCM10008956_31860 [Deinococcus arenae]
MSLVMGLVQQDAPQAHPYTGLLPFLKPSLAGSATPEPERRRKGAPRQTPSQDVQDTGEGMAGGNPRASSARRGWGSWKNTLHDLPERVRNKRFDHLSTLVQPYCPQALKNADQNLSHGTQGNE